MFVRDDCRGNRNTRTPLVVSLIDNGVCSVFLCTARRSLAPSGGRGRNSSPAAVLELGGKARGPSGEASGVRTGSVVLFSDPRPAGSPGSSDDPQMRLQTRS